MRHVDTQQAAARLAADILGVRSRPLVLISTIADGAFLFDPDVIARELVGAADVVTIATGDATYALERSLPAKCHAFAGAARSYPMDFGADPDWRRSILRFPDRHSTDELVEDALAQLAARTPAEPRPPRAWVAATVERVSGASGNVAKLDDGRLVMVVADHLPAALSLPDALVEGARVEGWLTDQDLAPEPADLDLARFEDGAVTLARVVKVTPQRAYLVLHPGAPPIPLRRRDVIPGVDDGENADIRVSDVVRPGQTMRVRVIRSGASVSLSLLGVEDDTEVEAPLPLLRGGPPWLREGVHGRDAAEHQDASVPSTESTPDRDASVEAPELPRAESGALAALRDEIGELRGAFVRLGRELRAGTDLEALDRLRDEAAGLAAELQRERASRRERDGIVASLRQELRDARGARPAPDPERRTARQSWPSEDEWLRFEVFALWARRTIAAEKAEHPLGEYTIGRAFLQSLHGLDDAQLEKALRTIVDVVSGRAATIPGRQLHRLRDGDGGSDPYVVRSDGAACWRASIEVNAPSARRLHYWRVPGGSIELSRIVLHDDVAP